ncbi:MAG: hypothetical protein EAZ91_09930 [Cytophagales bacterium]|nr:MAG: hypothetical protein EAZ91_09930 [Cytophagales bacterium]
MKPLLYFLIILAGGCSDGGIGAKSNDSAGASAGAGTGGSMARFTVAGNTLYLVSSTTLRAYDVKDSRNPIPGQETKLGFGVETIFPYGKNLFIGTQTGMIIYDASREGDPRHLSTYSHIRSCDPVVVQGNLAYVTLRNGTPCGGGINVLEVIDVSDLRAPKILKSFPMQSPHGLGVDGNVLFVCEGDSGLKLFDLTDPINPKLLQHLQDVRSYDVIPSRDLLIVTGKDGIYQYSYADRKTLKLLSTLPVEPPV